ncbi:hypothetical protein VDGL01_10949 [Verticillium dahliae]
MRQEAVIGLTGLVVCTIAWSNTSTQCRWHIAPPLAQQERMECPLPLGDPQKAGDNVDPWTHELSCVYARSEQGTPSGQAKAAYCLFAHHTFRGNHGLSITTSPEIAADIVASGALEDMEDSWDWERRIFTPGPVVTDKGPSYAVKDLPGRGKGVIAQRTIRQGEILMLDHPAVLVASDFSSQMQPEMRETFFRRALSQLPRDTQKRLVNLARSDGADPLTPVYDIVTTNTCGVFLGDNVAHIGLFPEVSRLNHACKPNAFFRFSQRTLTMQVIAYRDIHAGEEITINYAPLGMPHKVRKKYLFDNYGFHCRCSLCQSSPEDRAISDARRMRIVEVRGNMRKAHEKGKLSDAITYAEELLSLSEAEGLTPLMHEYHEILASIYLEQLDIPNARKYGQMTLDGWIRFKSVDSFHVEAVRGFMRQIDHVEEMLRETKGVYS